MLLSLDFDFRYTGDGSKYSKRPIEYTSPAWLHSSGWDHSLPTVLIVHGYGGAAEDSLPGAVLRDGKAFSHTAPRVETVGCSNTRVKVFATYFFICIRRCTAHFYA